MSQDAGSSKDAALSSPDRSARRALSLDRRSLLAFGMGALTVAGFAPLYLYPLPVITLAVLLGSCLHADSAKRAAALGWWFGFGLFLVGVSWVYVSLNTFGSMPAPIAAFFTLLFCAFLALFPAMSVYGLHAVRASPWMKLIVVTPAAWTLTEWVRSWIFTGFPWLAMGYSQVPASPLAGYAPVIGIYGVSLAVLASAGVLALLAPRFLAAPERGAKRWRRAAPAMAVVLAMWLGGFALKAVRWTEPAGEALSVTLLQGNIAQEIKWTSEGLRTTLIRYRDLALASKAKLIVFPETAVPLFLRDIPADYLSQIADHARHNGGDVLLGVPEQLASGDYYNSVMSLGISPVQIYRKSHLVPFGEFIPLRPVLGWIVSVLSIPLQDFSRGSIAQQPLNVGGQRVAVNICYEDVFGEEIIRQLPAATILANVSNVAWFGHSIAPYQHLQISQARALETGRYMIRATNTGMTGVVDERGEIVEVAPQFSTAVVNATVQGYAGATPYVRLGNTGVLALCVILLAAGVITARMRR